MVWFDQDFTVSATPTSTDGKKQRTDGNGCKPPETVVVKVTDLKVAFSASGAELVSQSENSATFHPTGPGEITVTAEVNGSGGPCSPAAVKKTAKLNAVRARLHAVSFSGSTSTPNYWELISDDATISYGAPQWQDDDYDGNAEGKTEKVVSGCLHSQHRPAGESRRGP